MDLVQIIIVNFVLGSTTTTATSPNDYIISITSGLSSQSGPRVAKSGFGAKRHYGIVAVGLKSCCNSFYYRTTTIKREGKQL